MLDLFIGDPVYDEQKNIIRRDFGVKNIVAIMVVGFAGYSLMGEMKPISGKRKMRGGGGEESSVSSLGSRKGPSMRNVFILSAIAIVLSLTGVGVLADYWGKSMKNK